MSEFEEKLNALLSNPEALSQVMHLAQSLDLGGGPAQQAPTAQAPPSPPAGGGGGGPSLGSLGALGGLSGLGDLLGQLDPKLISRLLPLVGELAADSGSDERMQLLLALRPFLKPERREKVERAAKAAKLLHVGKKLLTTMGESNV